jgi:hypothetical protein
MLEASPLLLSLALEDQVMPDPGSDLRCDECSQTMMGSFCPQILPVLSYFQEELGFSRYDLWMALRSFPSILGLDVGENIHPVIDFLKVSAARTC